MNFIFPSNIWRFSHILDLFLHFYLNNNFIGKILCNLVKKPFAVILFYHNVLLSNLMPNIVLCVSYTFLFVGNCDEWATSYNQQTSTIEYLYGINYSTPYHRLGQRRNYRFVLKPNYFRKQRFSSSFLLTWSPKWPR